MDYIELGSILKPQGIRGEVKIKFGASDELDLLELKALYLLEQGAYVRYPVERIRQDQSFAYVKLQGIEDRNEAETKRNALVFISKQDVSLPEGTHYISDLIGLCVVDDEGKTLGILSEVIETGSADVYLVKDGEKGFMFPALKRVIKKTDIAGKTMVLDSKALSEVAVYAV